MSIDLNELASAIGQLVLRFRVRRRLAADWTTINEVLLSAEIGLESDTGFFKFGDGVTAWAELAYAGGHGAVLGPENAGAAIEILAATDYSTQLASSNTIQTAAVAATGNRQVMWLAWSGYPAGDTSWAPAQGTTFYLYASRRGTDDDGTGAVLCYGEITMTAGNHYTPDNATRFNVVGGASTGIHSSLVASGADKGVDIGGYHRDDNNLPSDACATDWATAPVWANWAIALPLGQGAVYQANPGDGQPVPGYGEWAVYASSLPGDSTAPPGSERLFFEPTTQFAGLNADGFQETVPADRPQISHVDFVRTLAEGLELTVIVNGTTYVYALSTGESDPTGLANVINADSTAAVVASVASDVLVLTGKVVAVAFTVSGSSKGRPLLIVNDGIRSIRAGTNVSVDSTDPHNPVISATGGGSGGGGGNLTADSHPTAANAMDDEFEGLSLDSKWTWVQQNTASEVLLQGSLVVTAQNTSANVINALEQSLPSGDCQFVSKACALCPLSNNYAGALHLRESSSGKVMSMGIFNNAGSLQLVVTNGTMAGGYSALPFAGTVDASSGFADTVYYKVAMVGTNVVFSMSKDGILWAVIGTYAAATYFTVKPDKIGFAVRCGSSAPSYLSVDFFRRIS